ncbi:hypothetical protein LTR65_009804 [Meristemomyces frigidus]
MAMAELTKTAIVVDTVNVTACSGAASCTPPLATSSELSAYGSGMTSISLGPPQTVVATHADYVDCSSGTGSWDGTYVSTSFCILSTAASPSPTTILSTTIMWPPAFQDSATLLSSSDTAQGSTSTKTPIAITTAAATSKTTPGVSTTTIVEQPTNYAVLQDCYQLQGGLQMQEGGMGPLVYDGCGAMFHHMESCYESLAPWVDPYDLTQSTHFQACLCETSSALPFLPNSVLWRNFSGCANCMIDFAHVATGDLNKELERLDNFCCAQIPNAYLFLQRLQDWLYKLHTGTVLQQQPLTGVITLIGTLAPLFTTTPPLLNEAYGASAALFAGSLGGVTPSLTTATYSNNGKDSLVTS